MKILITVLLFLTLLNVINAAYARTPERCIEMMRLHYLWMEQGRVELAEKQFKTADRACAGLLKNKVAKAHLTELVLSDKNLIALYKKLLDKQLVTSRTYP